MALAPGTRLGAYEIVSLLGAGGMGEVYKARDPRLGRDVAIKILPADFTADAERLRRFEQEARATAALNHPNIVSLYDIGIEAAQTYVVSELLVGETLREVLAAGALPVKKVIDYGAQIARGLAAAHERAIVHRDVKPENVFITRDGRAKILDFGLAKMGDGEAAVTAVLTTALPRTGPGVVLGTVGYMSPEQVRGASVDYRSDVFSFGAVLYEMLSGHRAFAADTAAETMTAILKSDPPVLSGAPPGLQRIVERCLEKRPEARFQSTGDLAFALEASSPSTASTVMSQSSTGRRVPVREVVAWGLSGVLVLALTGALITRSRPGPADTRVFRYSLAAPASARLPSGAGFPAISPDGKQLAFVAREGGTAARVWVRSLDALQARPLAGTDNATAPFWSPDGRQVAFFSGFSVNKVDVSGGPVVKVCQAPGPPGGGTWNANGEILFGLQSGGIFRVSDKGGSLTEVTTLDAKANERAHTWPEFLPDGRHFLYFASGRNQLMVGSLDGRGSSAIGPAESKATYASRNLLFVRGGALVKQPFDAASLEILGDPTPVIDRVAVTLGGTAGFAASSNGVLVYSNLQLGRRDQLNWYDRSGQLLEKFGDPGPYRNPRLSPDGRRVLLDRQSEAGENEVWVFDDRGSSIRITTPPLTGQQPVWSPDGRRVAFTMGAPGPSVLFQKLASGVGSEQTLLKLDISAAPDDWHPDGQALLYHLGGTVPPTSLMLLPLVDASSPASDSREVGEAAKPRPIVESRFVAVDGRFSPDGKWLAYVSTESGRPEVHLQNFPAASTRWPISAGGGIQPVWRGDGRELFYIGADGKLMVVSITLGDPPQISKPHPLFEPQLAAFSFAVGGGIHHQYDVSRDGQRFLILTTSPDAAEPSFNVIVNWPALKN